MVRESTSRMLSERKLQVIATVSILICLIAQSSAFNLKSFSPVHNRNVWNKSTILQMSSNDENKNLFSKGQKGKILVLGGSGFLGGTIARRAVLDGYSVTSLSRRGKPDELDDPELKSVDYKVGDARDKSVIKDILEGGDYIAVFHCVGLLFDGDSGLGNFNRFVSGSGSVPEETSTYDDITRITAFNAIEAAEEYAKSTNKLSKPLPFIFTSAAEAGWPDVPGGEFVEKNLAPEWLKRYLVAKRAVESRLTKNQSILRPIIFRPSLIYSLDRIASLPPVGAFILGNKIGLPFVDRPVTVQALSSAAVRSISNTDVSGVQRYKQVDELSK